MKIKKILSAVLAVSMMAAVTGCGGSSESTPKTTDAANSTEAVADADDDSDSDAEAENDSEGGAAAEDVDFTEMYGTDPINITIYSQLANYSGELTGRFAELMKQKYNCVMTIIPRTDGSFDTRMESGDLVIS